MRVYSKFYERKSIGKKKSVRLIAKVISNSICLPFSSFNPKVSSAVFCSAPRIRVVFRSGSKSEFENEGGVIVKYAREPFWMIWISNRIKIKLGMDKIQNQLGQRPNPSRGKARWKVLSFAIIMVRKIGNLAGDHCPCECRNWD